MSRDEEIIGADHLTSFLQVSANLRVMGRRVLRKLEVRCPFRAPAKDSESSAADHDFTKGAGGSS